MTKMFVFNTQPPELRPALPRSQRSEASSPNGARADGAQDCSTCRNVVGCWTAKGKVPLSESDVVSNLLTCRIQRGIDKEKSVRALLRLIRPKLRKTAGWVSQRTGMPPADAVRDMEGVAIMTLVTKYVMGESAPPLVWLFHAKYGAVRLWALRTTHAASRERDRHLSYGSTTIDIGDGLFDGNGFERDLETRILYLNRHATDGRVRTSVPATDAGVSFNRDGGGEGEAEAGAEAEAERVHAALDVIEDGVTLPLAEYRVLRFCLTHARESVRQTEWLHCYLASRTGMPRKNVSQLYGMAYRRVLEAVGLRTAYLRSRGIELPLPKTRRAGNVRTPLSADEIIAALRLLGARASGTGATVFDIAWALGISHETVRQVRLRYSGMSPEQVRARLS